jgi:NADPH-dependent ferric siderophore reductase
MAGPTIRQLTVVKTERITPNMQRVTLGGDDLADFPEGQESGYIKLLFPRDPADLPAEPDAKALRPLMRTYTIRAFNLAARELVVDLVLHGEGEHAGPASDWARQTKPGDTLNIAGPGPTKLVNNDADWFLIAGDMTALPAISCNLEQLPATARGYAVIEIIEEADKQTLDVPAGMEIRWVVNPHPEQASSVLADAVRAVPWQEGRVSAWVACEFSTMRNLREYLKRDRELGRGEFYISSYWKIGRSEDQHKVDKREDADTQPAVD